MKQSTQKKAQAVISGLEVGIYSTNDLYALIDDMMREPTGSPSEKAVFAAWKSYVDARAEQDDFMEKVYYRKREEHAQREVERYKANPDAEEFVPIREMIKGHFAPTITAEQLDFQVREAVKQRGRLTFTDSRLEASNERIFEAKNQFVKALKALLCGNERVCEICGTVFIPRQAGQRFDKRDCSNIFHARKHRAKNNKDVGNILTSATSLL